MSRDIDYQSDAARDSKRTPLTAGALRARRGSSPTRTSSRGRAASARACARAPAAEGPQSDPAPPGLPGAVSFSDEG